MRKRFLMNYIQKDIKTAWIIRYGDKYKIEGHGRIKRKIKSIQHRLRWYNSKHYNNKTYYWEQARECYEQLQQELSEL